MKPDTLNVYAFDIGTTDQCQGWAGISRPSRTTEEEKSLKEGSRAPRRWGKPKKVFQKEMIESV